MRIWVLWEDQRGQQARGFGPHELLLSCLKDDFGSRFDCGFLKKRVLASPKKSSSKVLSELKENLNRLQDDGAVVAVFDRDQIHRLWNPQPERCRTALRQRIQADAGGGYEILFLEENVESLTAACCRALGNEPFPAKPRPEERDRLLGKLAWSNPGLRARVRREVPSFDRLVGKVGAHLAHL